MLKSWIGLHTNYINTEMESNAILTSAKQSSVLSPWGLKMCEDRADLQSSRQADLTEKVQVKKDLDAIKKQLAALMDHLGVGATPQRSDRDIKQEISNRLHKQITRAKRADGRA